MKSQLQWRYTVDRYDPSELPPITQEFLNCLRRFISTQKSKTMYTDKNYRTKKEFLADLKAGNHVGVFQPGGFFPGKTDGTVCLEGPHYPEAHRWYAEAVIKDSRVISAK